MDRSAPVRKAQEPRRSPSRLAAELLPLLLVLGSTAGALALIILAHRRPMPPPEPTRRPTPAAVARVAPAPKVEIPSPPPPPSAPPPPPEDLTTKEVARLESIAAAERDAVARSDRAIESLQRARKRTASAVETLDRNERKVRARAEALEERALAIEAEAENLAIDREILNKNRETARAALDRDRLKSHTAHAIQPFKGPNGSWRRPIAIECTADQIKIQPDGPTFGLMDLSPMLSMRGNPFLAAVASETMKAQQGPTPDGAPSVPYILFVVRPDGIRPYYEALARLETMGLAFGYELVAQDWEITYPDSSNPSDWDHSEPAPERWPTSRPLAGGPDHAGPDRTADLQRRLAELESQVRRGPYATDSNGKPMLFAGGSDAGGFGADSPGGRVLGGGGMDDLVDSSPRGGAAPGTRPGFAANAPAWQGQGQGARPGQGQGGGGGFGTTPRDGQDRFVPPSGTDLASRGFGSFTRGGGGLGMRAQPGPGSGGNSGGAGGQPWPGPGTSGGADGGTGSGDVGSGTAAGGTGMASGGGGTASGTAGSSDLASSGSAAEFGNASGGPGGSGNLTSGSGGAGSSTPGSAGSSGGSGSSGSGSGGTGSGPSNSANLTLWANTNPPPSDSMPPSPSRSQPPGAPGGTASAGAKTPTKPARDQTKKEGNTDGPKVEHGLELVVVCESKGVIIHPGAYRLSHAAIKGKDGNLVKALRTIVDAKQLAEPELKWVPRIRFLVEPGGHRTLWSARGQLFAEGLDWPSSVQTATGLSMRPPTQEVR